MAPTLLASHLPKTAMCQGTARVFSLRTALLHVPLTFASCMFCLVGKGPHMTQHFSMMPIKMISTSQAGSITLQMLALPPQILFLSHIEMCGTICVNGVIAMIGNVFFFL